MHGSRAEIGIDAQRLAEGEKSRLRTRRRVIPFGSADRAEENGVGRPASGERIVAQRLAAAVDGGATKIMLGEAYGKAFQRRDMVDDGAGDAGDFRADPVAGQEGDRIGGHAWSFS